MNNILITKNIILSIADLLKIGPISLPQGAGQSAKQKPQGTNFVALADLLERNKQLHSSIRADQSQTV